MTDQQEPSSFFSSITPTVWVALIAAFLSLSGVLAVALINAHAQRELEREQFESNLILKAIGSGDKKMSYDNLRFLVEAGLIRAKSEKVSRLIQDTSFHFRIPRDSSSKPTSWSIFRPQRAYPQPTISGIVMDDATSQPLEGVTVSTKTRRSGMRNIKSQVTDRNGLFNLPYPPRNYFLNYSRPGYVEQRSIVQAPEFRVDRPVLIIRMKRY